MTVSGLSSKLVDLNEYRIMGPIGQGCFAEVRFAKNKETDETVAIKTMFDELTDHTDQIIFMREVQSLALLSHPLVLQFIGFTMPCVSNGFHPSIVTEVVAGGNLQDLINYELCGSPKRGWNNTVKSKILFGIAEGMRYVHSMGVIHRDLKPENIFCTRQFQPKISDFGHSKIVKNNQIMHTANLGTPFYMAPEMYLVGDDYEKEYTNKVDVYGFAVMILAFFVQEFVYNTPRQPRDIEDLRLIVTNGGRMVIPDEVPNNLKELITRCWSQQAEDRPSFAEIVDLLLTSEYTFPGTNMNEYTTYQQELLEMRNSNCQTEEPEEQLGEFDFDAL